MDTRPETPPRGRSSSSAKERAAWGTISRERIVEAAIGAVRDGKFEQMTIRSLAGELGVAPMSLYRHVRDKDDLLGEVVEQLLAGAWRPPARVTNWREWVVQAADKLRKLLVTQPAALYVYLRHPVVSPTALSRMDAMMEQLDGAGLGTEAAYRAYGAIQTYTIGFAALEAARADWVPAENDPDTVISRLAAFTSHSQFLEGLKYILDGMASEGNPKPETKERAKVG